MTVTQLGYLGLDVGDLAAWRTFAAEVLGMDVIEREGGFALRHDDRAARFFVTGGGADDIEFVGWEVADAAALDRVAGELRSAGFEVVDGGSELAGDRRVEGVVVAQDPLGLRTELFWGPQRTTPWVTDLVPSGFVAGELGLGHIVLSGGDLHETLHFYRDLLGLRLSDRVEIETPSGLRRIAFTHANPRHHSAAFFEGTAPRRLAHFMVEIGNLDELGAVLDRCAEHGIALNRSLGRHPNDLTTSFYGLTPSGFEFECGFGGRLIDDATWDDSTVYDHASMWGHRPVRADSQPSYKR